jgi:hypothetical protein
MQLLAEILHWLQGGLQRVQLLEPAGLNVPGGHCGTHRPLNCTRGVSPLKQPVHAVWLKQPELQTAGHVRQRPDTRSAYWVFLLHCSTHD